jgi:outer membrane protein assembly factor BamA
MKASQRKYWYYILYILSFLIHTDIFSQNNYQLIIHPVDKDNSLSQSSKLNLVQSLNLQTSFTNKEQCIDYIFKLPGIFTAKGYPSASIDSIYSDPASTHINLYLGEQYKWIEIKTDSIDNKLLTETGWNKKIYQDKKMDFSQLQNQQAKILNYYETRGYPFAAIKLDSIKIDHDKIRGQLKIDKGPLYLIDSIRIYGKVKIKNLFLQRYLGIEKRSVYNKNKLQNISKKLLELPYLQEQQRWDLNMLGSGSVLNLYLQPKRSSQIDFLVGFLPGNAQTGKLQVTADVNLNLKNALGSGESILLNWQQLQKQSPRLNIGYQHPYIFNSPFGIGLGFSLLKRDSSYLQINGQLGLLYVLSANQSGKIFIQNQRTYLLSGGFDTNQIKITKRLPSNIDVSANSVGIDYEWLNTNYIYNPRQGNELRVTTAIGLKKITKNNEIANLKDAAAPLFNFNSLYDSFKLNTYQLRVSLIAAHYFPMGKKNTLKAELNAGIFQSHDIFRNELFQLGGSKLLRGFDEESIYASQYGIFTAEYRILTGINSYLFGFTDIGLTKTNFQKTNFTNNFISTGLGLSFETKFGILNVSYAIGKRNDVKFDLQGASKIHFGYINYF